MERTSSGWDVPYETRRCQAATARCTHPPRATPSARSRVRRPARRRSTPVLSERTASVLTQHGAQDHDDTDPQLALGGTWPSALLLARASAELLPRLPHWQTRLGENCTSCGAPRPRTVLKNVPYRGPLPTDHLHRHPLLPLPLPLHHAAHHARPQLWLARPAASPTRCPRSHPDRPRHSLPCCCSAHAHCAAPWPSSLWSLPPSCSVTRTVPASPRVPRIIQTVPKPYVRPAARVRASNRTNPSSIEQTLPFHATQPMSAAVRHQCL